MFFFIIITDNSQLNIIGSRPPTLFPQLNTEINYICPSVILMKQKNMLSFSGNAVVREAFLLHRFSYLSQTHAQISHRSLLRILWMQRNI